MIEILEFDGLTEASFSVDMERRTMTALVVPWGAIGRHKNGRKWRFARGSLKFADAKFVRLNDEHTQSARLGRAVAVEDTDEGLVATFRIYDGRAGDRALAAAEHRVKTGFSVEIEADAADTEPDPENPGVLLVNMAHLTGVGFVRDPAFDDARLISVRANIHGGAMETCEHCGQPLATGVTHTCSPAPANTNTPPAPAPTPAAATPAPAPAPTPPPNPAPAPAMANVPAPAMAGPASVAFSADQFAQLIAQFGQPPATAPADPDGARPVVDPTAVAVRPAATQVSEPLAYAFSHAGRGKYHFAPTENDFSTDLLELAASIAAHRDYSAPLARLDDFVKATFADVEVADLPGTLPTIRRPDMWVPHLDYATPLWDLTGRGPTPEGGRKFDIPKFTSAAGLVAAATEKTEPAGGSYVDELQTVTPGQLWGKVEITRQVWRQGGNPALSAILWEEMVRAFYEAREAAIATFLNTLTAATDIALTGTPAATPDNDDDQQTVVDLEGALADLQFARGGNRFTAAATHQALYRVLARVKDDMGRPLYPQMAPQNTNGTTARLYKTIDVGGTTFVPAYALGTPGTASVNSWIFDPSRVFTWAGAPERLFWDFGATVQTANVPNLSFVTLGLYADYAVANTDINAVRQVTFDPSV